jgi:hypothetical protein
MSALLLLAVGACVATPDPDVDPLVVTESSPAPQVNASPERAAAVAEMRAKALAAETAPYPDVFQAGQVARLAAREEPRPVAEVEAIELELAALARQRQRAGSPGELAALDARAAELRRLARRQGASRP